MMAQDWKSTGRDGGQDALRISTVSAPNERQGVRDALRGAYRGPSDLPRDWMQLLAKLR